MSSFSVHHLPILGLNNNYTRKQLVLSARLSHRNSVCPSICASVRLSHGWISQKRCKL